MIDPRNVEWLAGADERERDQRERRNAAFLAKHGISEAAAIRAARARLVETLKRDGYAVTDTDLK